MEVSDRLMPEPLFPPGKIATEWGWVDTWASVYAFWRRANLCLGFNRDSSASAVHSLVAIMTTISGSILDNWLLTEFIQPPGENGWRKFVEIFYKDTSSGRRKSRTHRKMEGPIHS